MELSGREASCCIIKISIISKIILFYYKRHNFNPWSVYVWNHVILTQWIIVTKVMVNASMDTCGRLYRFSFREDEYLLYFKVKGGSRVLGKGGTKINRGDCACYGAIHRPKGCDALGVAGGWFGGGCPSEMIMNCSWMVLEQFMCSSWTLIHEQFMNYPWTWNGQVHEVGEVHELGVHKFEFMNLWVHELFINNSSWIVHELLVHDLFMNNFWKWYMNSSGIVHEHLFMNSSWIVHE